MLPTPLLQFDRNVFVKMELFHYGGSHKTRAAQRIIDDAIVSGDIVPGKTTVIEKTGGNFGFGLINACRKHGVDIDLAVGLSFSKKKRLLLEAFGATLIGIDKLEEGWTPKEVVEYHLENSEKMGKHYFFTDQFNNPGSLDAHTNVTGPEIAQQLKALSDNRNVCFVSCAGTGASLMGIQQALKDDEFNVLTCLVEPEGVDSQNGVFKEHVFEGMSVGVEPPFLNWDVIDKRVYISEHQMLDTQKSVSAEQGYLVGNTSAACISAAKLLSKELPNSIVFTIAYDSGLWYENLTSNAN